MVSLSGAKVAAWLEGCVMTMECDWSGGVDAGSVESSTQAMEWENCGDSDALCVKILVLFL